MILPPDDEIAERISADGFPQLLSELFPHIGRFIESKSITNNIRSPLHIFISDCVMMRYDYDTDDLQEFLFGHYVSDQYVKWIDIYTALVHWINDHEDLILLRML